MYALAAATVLLITVSGCQRDAGENESPAGPHTPDDSLKLARKYNELGVGIWELKREMWARRMGWVYGEERWQPAQDGPIGVLPTPLEAELPPLPDVRVEWDTSGQASARRRRTTLTYSSPKPPTPQFERWVRAAGMRFERVAAGDSTPNAIAFGDSVALSDVKAVALQMYTDGIPARSIRFFASGEGDPNAINVKFVGLFDRVPPLTVDEIRALRPAPPPPVQ